jgi:hypothetical protein
MKIEMLQKKITKKQLTFGGIEASNLDYVITFWPIQLVHFFLHTQTAEFAHVEL